MQLFHIPHTIKNGNLIINDSDTIQQCKKVLRLKIGDLIHIQSTLANTTTRHLIKITDISTTITGNIIESNCTDVAMQRLSGGSTTILIAMPNKADKAELMVQKLTEIGVQNIIFWPAERSIIKERNTNKQQRLEKIAKEAVEQSRGRQIPEISFREHPEDCIGEGHLTIFDKALETLHCNVSTPQNVSTPRFALIGPEGGLTQNDYARFKNIPYTTMSLGDNILRMETAAIIGAWLLKNK